MRVMLIGLVGLLFSVCLRAQDSKVSVKVFGHLQYDLSDISNDQKSYFSLGEQDFFITSSITDRISFLGETVVKYDNSTSSSFAPSIERAQIKYDYYKNHSLIIGKIHTPVNYWNDVYHHGRLFFPTIERPLSFNYFIPVHKLGLRLQGQNLGKRDFGYDLMVGNGIATSDIGKSGFSETSFMASVYAQPLDNSRFGISYYRENMKTNNAGAHSGHSSVISGYDGPVKFELLCASGAYFGKRIEFLAELAHNRTVTDSLGLSLNYGAFLYVGWRINQDNKTFYVVFDYLNVSDKELHTTPIQSNNFGLGYKYDISLKANVKCQLERSLIDETHFFHDHEGSNFYNLKIQFSYGL